VNIGWPPRVGFWSYSLWLVVLASQVIRLAKSHARRAEGERVLAGGERFA
jgi:hypothetical protein